MVSAARRIRGTAARPWAIDREPATPAGLPTIRYATRAMARGPDPGSSDESGILVYPKMSIPKRESEPRVPRPERPSAINGKRVALVAVLLLAGAAGGFFLRPLVTSDPRIAELEAGLGEATAKVAELDQRATQLAEELEKRASAKAAVDQELARARRAEVELATRAEQLADRQKRAEAIRTKLRAAVDKAIAVPALEGEDIRLRLPDRILFKPNDAELTPRGKQVLARLANPLKELGDRQIWVAGHTDDSPIPLPPAPKPAPPRRGQKPAPPPPAPAPKFATNWELSSARALAVVHYLQDVAKLDPARLAARAHSQYRPVGRNKEQNRRLEILVAPRPE
jgi:chemotaxis protein MotB